MKKNNIISIVCKVVLCLLPIIVGILLYDKIPVKVAVHFNPVGNPDNYASKNFALFGMPIILACGQLLLSILILHTQKQMKNTPKLLKITEWMIPVMTIYIYYLMVSYSLNSSFNIGKGNLLLVGTIFCILGNYFPKMNYTENMNYIHPKPKDEKSFRFMMKTFGYSFLILGILFIILSIFY
ncbi:MAG: DUF1648 domain-containing protein [Bacilli bacterium]|nr:DUF1648 domain-containing protein [Bacilli bacterium]